MIVMIFIEKNLEKNQNVLTPRGSISSHSHKVDQPSLIEKDIIMVVVSETLTFPTVLQNA